MTKPYIKPVGRRGGANRNVGAGSGEFTNANDLKNRFWANADTRRKAGDKEHGDAGYWTGGRCNWGGSHNLQEDCETLAVFFNNIASIDNDMKELKLSIDESEFNNRKQQLTSKLQNCIDKCQVSSAWSIGNVCCIWNDYFGEFLKRFLDSFSEKIKKHLNDLQNIEPIHQKEILQLEVEIKGAENKYNEAMANATKETDPVKKAQFIAIAQEAEKTIKQAKEKLANNPLSKLARYSYIKDLGRLIGGNISPDPPTQLGNISGGSGSGTSGSGSNSNKENGGSGWIPLGGNLGGSNNQQQDQQQLILIAVAVIVVVFLLMNQKNNSSHRRDYEDYYDY